MTSDFDFWRWLTLLYKLLYKRQYLLMILQGWVLPFPYLFLFPKLLPSLPLPTCSHLLSSSHLLLWPFFSLARFVPNLYLCLRRNQTGDLWWKCSKIKLWWWVYTYKYNKIHWMIKKKPPPPTLSSSAPYQGSVRANINIFWIHVLGLLVFTEVHASQLGDFT